MVNFEDRAADSIEVIHLAVVGVRFAPSEDEGGTVELGGKRVEGSKAIHARGMHFSGAVEFRDDVFVVLGEPVPYPFSMTNSFADVAKGEHFLDGFGCIGLETLGIQEMVEWGLKFVKLLD